MSHAQCGDVANRLDTTHDWSFLMSVSLLGESVLDGTDEPDADAVG